MTVSVSDSPVQGSGSAGTAAPVFLTVLGQQGGTSETLLKTATQPRASSSPGADLVADDCGKWQ